MSYLVRFFISISLLFVFNSGYSQKIIIIDSSDNLPISNVTVFGKQSLKSLISNDKGIVDLEQFHQNDTLLIGHISYSSVQLINNLTSNNTTVFLEPNTQALSEVILSVARNKESREKISKQVSLITNKDLKEEKREIVLGLKERLREQVETVLNDKKVLEKCEVVFGEDRHELLIQQVKKLST